MILDLHRQGLSLSAIARRTGLDRKTVRTCIKRGLEPPVYAPPAAQQGHGETQQICLAHVLRDVQCAIDAGEPAFAPDLCRLLQWTIRVGRRCDDLKDRTLQRYHGDAERRLEKVLSIPVTTDAGRALLAQTKRWRGSFFTFPRDRDVPPTNNESERALRPSVIFRKVTNGFRSAWATRARGMRHGGSSRFRTAPLRSGKYDIVSSQSALLTGYGIWRALDNIPDTGGDPCQNPIRHRHRPAQRHPGPSGHLARPRRPRPPPRLTTRTLEQ